MSGGNGYGLRLALARIYDIKPRGRYGNGCIYIPKCLVGRRIRVVLVD